MESECAATYSALPSEAFYVFRTGRQVWVAQPGDDQNKQLLANAVDGESPNVKWFTEINRLEQEGFKKPIQFWVLP